MARFTTGTISAAQGQQRLWRVTLAARAFVLALATGQLLSAGTLDLLGVTLIALLVVASMACVAELDGGVASVRWTPVVEAVLASALILSSEAPVTPLVVYLTVPPVVAGLRGGAVQATNAALAIAVTMLSAWIGADALQRDATQIAAAVPWVAAGLGFGLLAAWQTRSFRVLEAQQAPFMEAHRLMAQLHTLSSQMPMGLDSETVADRLLDLVADTARADRAVMLVSSEGREPHQISARGPIVESDLTAARLALQRGTAAGAHKGAPLLLRIADRTFGLILLFDHTLSREGHDSLQQLVDAQSVRLDTALLFDELRAVATSEERSRLAREIHDGVAQEIVSLGYLVDDLDARDLDVGTRATVEQLRSEVSRLVGELRMSILDLRSDLEREQDLATALTDYARVVGADAGLRVHLTLDESGPPLPRRTQEQLMRIVREAVTNVRKHARADNLWVALSADGNRFQVRIEDDGRGATAARSGHYGLATMRERAKLIGATFRVETSLEGGTVILVASIVPAAKGSHHVDRSPARR